VVLLFSVFGCEFSVVGFPFLVLGSRFSVLGFRFSVLGFHGDCGWVGLLIITGVISIAILFVLVVGCGVSVFGFPFSVLGSRLWVISCRFSVFTVTVVGFGY
jgi:hypothetical protein